MSDAVRTSRLFNLTSATFAFLLWGGWAFFVASRNSTAGGASPVISGLTQGIGSFCITLMMVRSVSWLYQCLSGNTLQLILPAVITVSITGSALASAHQIVGTANIIGTIAPALAVALCFNLFATVKIRKAATMIPGDASGDVK